MKKQKLLDWMTQYLRINRTISLDIVNTLYGETTYGGFTGRISQMRGAGWEIELHNGVYMLVGEPLTADDTGFERKRDRWYVNAFCPGMEPITSAQLLVILQKSGWRRVLR